MVPGGFDVTSSTTRFTSRTSFVMRFEMRASTSYGSRVQSAVMASSLETGRSTIGWPYVRPSPWTPTERTSASSTTGHCQISCVEPRAGQLLAGDGVGVTQNLETVSGDLTHDPDAEAGARKRLAADDHLRKTEFAADRAHLVLEEGAQRLDELELQVFGEPADVVVRLDVRGAGAAARLDDVGVERALHEEPDRLAVRRGLGDESPSRPPRTCG